MHIVIHTAQKAWQSKTEAGKGSRGATFATEKGRLAGVRVNRRFPDKARFGLPVPVCPGAVPLPGRLKPAPDKAVPVVPFVPVKKWGGVPRRSVFGVGCMGLTGCFGEGNNLGSGLQLVEIIGPRLHHFFSLFNEGGPVIGTS